MISFISYLWEKLWEYALVSLFAITIFVVVVLHANDMGVKASFKVYPNSEVEEVE